MDNTPLRSRSRLIPLGSIAVVAILGGCGGGGGDSGGSAAATQLAFTVNWEQPASSSVRALSSSGAVSDASPLAFDTPIPPSVNAIRFVFQPASGPSCCIAVVRGSQAFADRHIVLADVSEGQATLEVDGFPTTFAPPAGGTTTCPTRSGDGEPCEGDETTLPSFASDETPVDVVAGITNVVDVDVHSLPFLLNLNPANGENADDATPLITFTVVDANFGVDPDVSVRLRNSPQTVNAEVVSRKQCRDNDPELPDCSAGGDLEVQGFSIVAETPEALAPGETELRIRASNTAEPQRDMESNTTFVVPGEVTTTTVTTTTTIVTTTTTIVTTTTSPTETTTTTLVSNEETFCLRFSVSNSVDLVGISYDVSYASTGGDFVGSGENVSCTTLLNPTAETTFASYNDDDGSTLHTAIISGQTFSGPTDLAVCQFRQVPPLNLNALPVQVTEATAPDLSPASATVAIEETPCSQ